MEDYSIPSSGAIIGRWLAQKINEKINNHNSNSNDYDYPNIIEFRVDSPAKYNNPPLADHSVLDSLDKSLRLANLNDSQELKKVKELLNINGVPEFAKVYWLSMRY